MRPEFPGWNEFSEQQLRELAAAGHSATAIGRRMGTTRNAILGKCDRLRIQLRGEAKRAAQRGKRLGHTGAQRNAIAARPAAGYLMASPPRRFSWEEPLDGAAEHA